MAQETQIIFVKIYKVCIAEDCLSITYPSANRISEILNFEKGIIDKSTSLQSRRYLVILKCLSKQVSNIQLSSFVNTISFVLNLKTPN